jgi:hypothetical protein
VRARRDRKRRNQLFEVAPEPQRVVSAQVPLRRKAPGA